MALTLVSTPGAVDANTYCSLAEAEAYFLTRLHNTEWEDASSTDKNAALVWATSILDEEMNWYGWAMSEEQALRWPRSGLVTPDGYNVTSTTIPMFLRKATAEFALYLIKEDRLADNEMLGIKQIAVSSIQMTRDKFDKKSLIPQSVWMMVRPYGSKYSTASRIVRG